MKKDEIITYHPDEKTYDMLVYQAVNYAVISSPITVNRMNIDDVSERIQNIAKGKLAEMLFVEYCNESGVGISTEECTTPFYQVDRRDFLLGDFECDIKNNFFWNTGTQSPIEELIIKFPALVPNRWEGDQWSKRNESYFGKRVMFIFTFMQAGYLKDGDRIDGILSINLSKSQKEYLIQLTKRYQGKPQDKEPYTPEEFWKEFGQVKFIITKRSPLYITAYATSEHFHLFRDTDGRHVSPHYQQNPFQNWYEQTPRGAKFLGGAIFTRIKNATCPIVLLPPFKEFVDSPNP